MWHIVPNLLLFGTFRGVEDFLADDIQTDFAHFVAANFDLNDVKNETDEGVMAGDNSTFDDLAKRGWQEWSFVGVAVDFVILTKLVELAADVPRKRESGPLKAKMNNY